MKKNKYSLLAIALAAAATLQAATFDGLTKLIMNPVSTSSSTLVDATGLSATVGPGYSGDVLVISTYSGEKSNNALDFVANYQLNDGSSSVGTLHTRQIPKDSSAAGAGSALGVVNVTNGGTISLQHARISSKTVNLNTLDGSTITAIPLTADGRTLNHKYVSGGSVSSNSLSDTSVSTASALNVGHVHAGTSEIFAMASFDVTTVSGTVNGQWELQYSATGANTWTRMGNQAERQVTTNEGLVTLVAMANIETAGDYDVRLVQRSNGVEFLNTIKVDLVALSLSLGENEYLQSYEQTTFGTTGTTLDIALSQDMEVFAAANITATDADGDDGRATYYLNTDGLNNSPETSLAYADRTVDSTAAGSAAVSTIVSLSAADSNTLNLTIGGTSGEYGANSNLVAFGLSAVPEPQAYALFLGSMMLASVSRRRL